MGYQSGLPGNSLLVEVARPSAAARPGTISTRRPELDRLRDAPVKPPEPQLADFFAHCPAMLFVAEPGGAILSRSAALERQFRPSGEPSAGLADLVHPDD